MYQVYNETRLSFVSKEIWPNNDSTDALLAGQEPLWANLQKIVQHHSFMFEPLFKEILESNFSILKYPSTSKKGVARIVTISGFFWSHTHQKHWCQLADQSESCTS